MAAESRSRSPRVPANWIPVRLANSRPFWTQHSSARHGAQAHEDGCAEAEDAWSRGGRVRTRALAGGGGLGERLCAGGGGAALRHGQGAAAEPHPDLQPDGRVRPRATPRNFAFFLSFFLYSFQYGLAAIASRVAGNELQFPRRKLLWGMRHSAQLALGCWHELLVRGADLGARSPAATPQTNHCRAHCAAHRGRARSVPRCEPPPLARQLHGGRGLGRPWGPSWLSCMSEA